MKYLLTAFFILSSASFACSQNADTIYWSPCYKLKWDDFQGKPDTNSIHGAISRPGIGYSLSANEDSFSVKVYCYFLKPISWVRVKSVFGLNHEQGHFNIAELNARKLRKAIAEYKFNYSTVGKDINQLFQLNKQQRNAMDALYDKETNFSRNRAQQQLWDKKIQTALDSLKEYASR